MTARIIDGKSFAQGLGEMITLAIPTFIANAGRTPGLAVAVVGSDPASEVYVRSNGTMVRQLGMESFEHVLPETASHDELLTLVHRLNGDNAVDGVLVQFPLPGHLESLPVIEAIDPTKDVDGLHPTSACWLRACQGFPAGHWAA